MNQQVTGTLVGMEPRQGGWVAFAILQQGKQYPLKLSTKKPELIQQCQQLMGQQVTAAYNEQQSQNINPNSGQPYTNRYLEAITLGFHDFVGMPTQVQPQQQMPVQQYAQEVQQYAQAQAAPSPLQPVQPAPATVRVEYQRPKSPQETAQIHRQAASKVAAQVVGWLPQEERTLASLVRISEQLVKYYDEGVPWTVAPVHIGPQVPNPEQQPPPPGDLYGGDPGPQGIPHDDYGDIPL